MIQTSAVQGLQIVVVYGSRGKGVTELRLVLVGPTAVIVVKGDAWTGSPRSRTASIGTSRSSMFSLDCR